MEQEYLYGRRPARTLVSERKEVKERKFLQLVAKEIAGNAVSSANWIGRKGEECDEQEIRFVIGDLDGGDCDSNGLPIPRGGPNR
jgi:hypothetical protein